MGSTTGISYCHYTFSPWKSCTKVSPGCDNCYAEKISNRFGVQFGQRETRQLMADRTWDNPRLWDGQARRAGERRRVLCGSMCDWADNKAPEGQRERLFDVIENTPYLDWLLLTKRAPNLLRYWPWPCPDNVWLGVSVENRKHGLPRIEFLRREYAELLWLSIEPLLEDLGEIDLTGIDWVVCGGESGAHARPMDVEWAQSIREQCKAQGVAFYMKQLSAYTHKMHYTHTAYFPKDLQVREFPGG